MVMTIHKISRPLSALLLAACAVVFFAEPFLCSGNSCPADLAVKIPTRPYSNPGFDPVGRVYGRHGRLLFMTQEECGFGRSIIAALLFGSWIGSERRAADRPAGIMLMSLVCMGACTFCICGQFAFEHGTQSWDASRISAAIPSGVGFLGAGLIWKGQTEGGSHEVRGLATAASVWLSAAVGVACGGSLFAVALVATLATVTFLHYGPHLAGSTAGPQFVQYRSGEDTTQTGRRAEEEGTPLVSGAGGGKSPSSLYGAARTVTAVQRLARQHSDHGSTSLRADL